MATPFAIASRNQDRLTWMGAKHGDFDLTSANRIATGLDSLDLFHRKWGWKMGLGSKNPSKSSNFPLEVLS